MGAGDHESGYATAGEAVDIARRYDDTDLFWLARGDQGRALINMGRVAEALRLVDEMFVVAAEGQLSPVVTGIVYCNTIAYCVDGYALDHAREWTDALTRWCEGQPQMEEHFGFCLVHRAELHQLSGSWAIAHEESERAAATQPRASPTSSSVARRPTCRVSCIVSPATSPRPSGPFGRRMRSDSNPSPASPCYGWSGQP